MEFKKRKNAKQKGKSEKRKKVKQEKVYFECFKNAKSITFKFYSINGLKTEFTTESIKDFYNYLKENYKKSTKFYCHNLHDIATDIFIFLINEKIRYDNFTNEDKITYYFKFYINTRITFTIYNAKQKFLDKSILDAEKRYNLEFYKIMYERLQFLDLMDCEKTTIAGDAMHLFRKKCTKKIFDEFFPYLDKEIEIYANESVYGGINFINENFKEKELNNLYYYDINKSYTASAFYEKLPFGYPKYFKGKYEKDINMPLFIQKINVNLVIKENKVPFYKYRYKDDEICTNNTLFDQRITTTYGNFITIYVNNVDLELLFENYNILSIEYIDGYKFYASDKIFKEHITDLLDLEKKQPNKIKRDIIKSCLNFLWGKFCQQRNARLFDIRLIDKEFKYCQIINVAENKFASSYTPIFSFITAYGRKRIIPILNENMQNLVYSNTDSIITIGKPKSLKIGQNIGEFKAEYENVKGIFFDLNVYKIDNHTIIGGASIDKKNTFFSTHEFTKENIDYFFKQYIQ